jgi:hypothetical protein
MNDVDETNMAEELIRLILDWQDTWPVGSELIAAGKDEEQPPDDETDLLEDMRKRVALLRLAAIWGHRDMYNDAREKSLRTLLAQVKVTLSDPNRDRREALEHFREQMEAESQAMMLILLEQQEQGPVSLDS